MRALDADLTAWGERGYRFGLTGSSHYTKKVVLRVGGEDALIAFRRGYRLGREARREAKTSQAG